MKSTAKTVSWLVVSGVLITGTGWYESGSFQIGLLAALWACLLKTPIYWLHEVVWERKRKPKLGRVSLPVLQVVYAG